MKILVTGGAGFIGSYLVERLLYEGHNVTVLDNFQTGTSNNLKKNINNARLTVINDSILNQSVLKKIISEVDYIFHLAAAVGVFNIVNFPLNSLEVNLKGTQYILEYANLYCKPVFFTSSSEVYGKNSAGELNELSDRILGSTHVLRWSYSQAKALDETLALAYFRQNNLPIRIVRLFNTVGLRQRADFGMVIPRFIEAAQKNSPIIIYGNGEQKRSFIHVLDVIDAFMIIAFSDLTIGEIYNIGNPREISIKELALKIIKIVKSKSKIEFLDYVTAYGKNFEDMERRFPNINKLTDLGWSAKRDLDEIINDML